MSHTMMRPIARREFLRVFGGTAATLSVARRATAQGVPAATTHTYKTAAGCEIKADVFESDGPAKRPVLIWIHGGGLIGGSRSGIPRPLRERLQKSGFVVVSIDYRLAPNTKLPAIIEDLEDAHRWVRARGPDLFGADAGRIV